MDKRGFIYVALNLPISLTNRSQPIMGGALSITNFTPVDL
jgi:hypothetical protein